MEANGSGRPLTGRRPQPRSRLNLRGTDKGGQDKATSVYQRGASSPRDFCTLILQHGLKVAADHTSCLVTVDG